jgi:translocation and assembly module TamB
VLGTEIGVDINDRVKASLLAAPNRSDIAPQFNLDYKASENISIEGAIDTQGTWESQLRLFLRF